MEQHYGRPQLRSKRIDKFVARFIMSRADMVFGGSGDAMRWALENGAEKSRTTVVRTGGVDNWHFTEPEDREPPRDKYGLKNKKVLLYVGRFDPIKYPQDVAKAAGIIRSVVKNAVLVMVGDGPMKTMLHTMSPNNTLFLDFVRCQRRLADIMAMADVVLAPLSGSALVECALAARPIVAYDVDWHGELIESGKSGVLVPFRDYEAMARATIDILRDGTNSMGIKARTKALEQHGLDNLFRYEVAQFDRILGVANE